MINKRKHHRTEISCAQLDPCQRKQFFQFKIKKQITQSTFEIYNPLPFERK